METELKDEKFYEIRDHEQGFCSCLWASEDPGEGPCEAAQYAEQIYRAVTPHLAWFEPEMTVKDIAEECLASESCPLCNYTRYGHEQGCPIGRWEGIMRPYWKQADEVQPC